MAYLTHSDTIGIIAIVAIFITSGMLYSAKAIDNDTLIMIFLGTFGFIIAKFAVPLAMAGLVQKIYGKGMAAYWDEIKKELRETPNEYDFSYDMRLPEGYFPEHAIILDHYGLALFEINRDDMTKYAGERIDILTYPYPQITIVYKIATNKIHYRYRGDINETIKFIEEHKDAFLKEGKEIILPQIIREMQFGQGIEVKTPEATK
jgi:hypothetical protein